jgi:hypothetical protein
LLLLPLEGTSRPGRIRAGATTPPNQHGRHNMKVKMMTATVLALVSLNAAAESCGSGACPNPSWPAGTLQGQQQQSQNNTTTQSPTMVLSGSNTVNNITSDLPAASGVTISSDGGLHSTVAVQLPSCL